MIVLVFQRYRARERVPRMNTSIKTALARDSFDFEPVVVVPSLVGTGAAEERETGSGSAPVRYPISAAGLLSGLTDKRGERETNGSGDTRTEMEQSKINIRPGRG